MLFAAMLLATSIVQAGHANNMTVDWLSVLERSDVIAVAEVSRSADLVPEYKVLDGLLGVARGDVIEVGGDPVLWPLTRRVGERFLLFIAKKSYDFDSISLASLDALPFLASTQPVPDYTELESLSEETADRFVGGESPTVEAGAALARLLLGADEEERRRLLLHHYLLRVFDCERAAEDAQACQLLKNAPTLDEQLDVVAAKLREHGTDVHPSFIASVVRIAGMQRFRSHLRTLPEELRQRVERAAMKTVLDPEPHPNPTPEEIERAILSENAASISLGALEAFVRSRCAFMVDYLQKPQEKADGCLGIPPPGGTRALMNLGLLTGRVCSPCSTALLDLAEKAQDDSAALAPTSCSNAGRTKKLFKTERYQRLKWSNRNYYLVWKVRMGHYDELTAALDVYDEEHRSIEDEQLQALLSLALEARAQAKGRALPRAFSYEPTYRTYIRDWVKKNADLFR